MTTRSRGGVGEARSKKGAATEVTHAEVCRLLAYDPETGIFRWRGQRQPKFNGREAGSICPQGYRRINVGGKSMAAHRLAWFIVHAQWPAGVLDHANRVRDDNRIANLREATLSQNAWNRAAGSGAKGVCFDRRDKKWRATIRVDGRIKSLGYYESQDEAASAYARAAYEAHGDFARALLNPTPPAAMEDDHAR